jgi:hypothetical protein
LDDGILTKSYTTTVGLVKGRTYKFKVQARNSVGYSDLTDEIAILAAQIPAQPTKPTTWISGLSVVVGWQTPDSGGSAITSYIVRIRNQDGSTYEDVTCDQTVQDVVINTACTVPIS